MHPLPPVVDAPWVDGHRQDLVLADVRWYLDGRSGREAYRAGHLPGAVFVDLESYLAAPATPDGGRHPLPTPEVFAEGVGRAGIGDDDAVVAYDDAGGVIAARLVWMLRVLGRSAALLDGGLLAGGSMETGEVEPPARVFTARAWPEDHVAGIDDAADTANVVIDARPEERYRGGHDPVDPRSGHIPGARSVPCRDNLDGDGRLLSVPTLRARFERAGVVPGVKPVSYCGSGVTACHNLLALEHAGLGPGRLFAGSWSQWSRDPARPVATGDDRSAGVGERDGPR